MSAAKNTSQATENGEARETFAALMRVMPEKRWRAFARIIMLLLVVTAAWAYFTELDEVAVAEGEVIPQGNVKVIQHLEGGIVRKIHVAEGDIVKPDDSLVLLSLGVNSMNAEELQVRIDALMLRRARLDAEATGIQPVFPDSLAERRPGIVKSERDAFAAREREQASTLKVLQEQVTQQELAVQEFQAQQRALVADMKLARQSLAMSRDLLSQGLVAKLEHLERRREVTRLKGQLETVEAAIPRAEASLQEARERITEEKFKFRSRASEELGQVQVNIARAHEDLGKAAEQVGRTQIRSPIHGVVKNLRYHTIGGVVRPGEPIMEIVPSQGSLVVEARLNPLDRGYVRVGQSAMVKVSSYQFVRYGGLDGKVSHIAADSNTDPGGKPYFRVIVTTKKAFLGDESNPLPISPGMQATVDIHTGTRSVVSYLTRPVLKLRHEAFRER